MAHKKTRVSRKKILRISNRLSVGGPAYNVAYLSKYISDDYETLIIAGNREVHEASSEYILTELGLSFEVIPSMYRSIHPIKDLKAIARVRKIINQFKPDIIHTHAAKAGLIGRIAAMLAVHRTKVVVHTYHGNVFEGYFSPLKSWVILVIERFLGRFSSGIVAISVKQKQDLCEKYRIAGEDKFEVIPLGFDLSRFLDNNEKKRQQFRAEWLIDADTLLVTIVARLAPIKDHEFFLNAFDWAKNRAKKKMVAMIVGDGEVRPGLEELAMKLSLRISNEKAKINNPDIIFTSWRRDIDFVNAGSDIICLTSINEGTPVSIIEAMASGKAVLTNDVGGVSDIVENGRNGIIAKKEVELFGVQLVLLVDNSEFRNMIASKASESVIRKFGVERLVSDVESFYDRLYSKS